MWTKVYCQICTWTVTVTAGGNSSFEIKACNVQSGYAARGNDCDDRNIQVYPGAADEPGDGIDANCDGEDG